MCGIAGVARSGGAAADVREVERMRDALTHRGPDSAGLWGDGPVALAARRLAIIDPEHGEQPARSEDGRVVVVLNGEIYNHGELRAGLRGRHELASRSDTEVLVHLYEEEGEAFLHRLRGMWALALWDARRDTLLLARDPWGIKPLYVSESPTGLAFASELKGLRAMDGFTTEVDPDALAAFLAFNAIPAPLTIFRGTRKLGPGHLLRWAGGRASVERWSRPRPVPAAEVRRDAPDALAAELRERLRDSVRAHLVSDVPVGVLLSGGVDSSALAALAAEARPGIATFSIGFREESWNELPLARLVARRYGTDHHELVVAPDAAELLPEIVGAFDEPFADSSALPTYLVSRLAAGHVTVALSGEGGDELFGGYETYVADLLAARVGRVARLASPLVERLPSSAERVSLDYRLKRFTRAAHLPPLERHHGWKEIFGPAARASLLAPGLRDGRDPVDLLRARWAETAGAEPLARLQDVDLGIYLPDDLLVKTDRASMAHSLEVRVPFLDPVVAELALALPTAQKVRGTAKKRLLRRAVAPLVPAEVLSARKRGFSIPAAAWLRGPLVPFAREVLSVGTLRRHGLLEPVAVHAVLERHVSGREDLSRQLWGLLSLTLWREGLDAQRP